MDNPPKFLYAYNFNSNNPILLTTDNAQIELLLVRTTHGYFQIQLRMMRPNIIECGNNLEEANQFLEYHREICNKIATKKPQMTESVLNRENANDLSLLWEEADYQLGLREKLLLQSIKFYQIASVFAQKMDSASELFNELQESEINEYEAGYAIIDEHKSINKEVLDYSLTTFDEGKELLERIREVSSFVHSEQPSSAACLSIESFLENLNRRRCYLEDLWSQKRIKIEQCIQICFLRSEINKSINWLMTEGRDYIENCKLGLNVTEAMQMQHAHNEFVSQHYKPIQESVTKCIRTADQFIHTGLENADEAHQEAHELLEKWEKFALKLEQRRKLLIVVGSFYKQTEEATQRLNQLETEIQIEHEKCRRLSAKKNKKSRSKTPKCPSPTELAQRHIDLQNQVAEISAACLREGKIVLEKVGDQNFQADHVIKKVFEFSEQVQEIKNKLSDDIHDKLEKTSETENESKKMSELIEFENKYSDLYSWIVNIGEAFLTQHRDLGIDVAYVSDYVDNHQQMASDIRENEKKFADLNHLKDSFLGSCDDQNQIEKVKQNLETMQHKRFRLKNTVDHRIRVATDYLVFVKKINQFRNLALDLQELFKTLSMNASSETIFENHVHEKMDSFENLYRELIQGGESLLNHLKISDNEVLKLNTNHLMSDIEICNNDSTSLYENVRNSLELWRDKVFTKKQFKEEWHDFMVHSRKLMQRIAQIEENIIPKNTGDLNSSFQIAESYKRSLNELMPSIQSATSEIDDSITRAEILSLNGDSQGQKDLIINELSKVKQKFLTRINEHKVLLQMAIGFFHNYHKLEEIVKQAEMKFQDSPLPSQDLNEIENLLKQHAAEKNEFTKLFNFTSAEGDEMMARVRQQDAHSEATDAVRKLLNRITEFKRVWESMWYKRERALKRSLESCQIMIEKNQINRDLDLLLNEIEHRKKNTGNSFQQVEKSTENFRDITENMSICLDNITRWKMKVVKVIEKRSEDQADPIQQKELQNSVNFIDKKWSDLHAFVKDYRDSLSNTTQFYKLVEEIEIWTEEKTETINRLIQNKRECADVEEADKIDKQIEQQMNAAKDFNESKVKNLNQLATKLYGNEGPNKVKYVVIKTIDLMNNFVQLKSDIKEVRSKLNAQTQTIEAPPSKIVRSSQIYRELPVVEPKTPPDFTKKLESAVVLIGSRHYFECIVTGSQPMQIEWSKNNAPLENSSNVKISFNEKTGVCLLVINETDLSDNSLFACKVTNELGLAETSAYLKIKEIVKPQGSAPMVVTPLESVQLNADSDYTLECIITGDPEPQVTWFKDSIEINCLPENIRSTYKESKFMNVRQLSILGTNPDWHSGAYTCRAKNDFGEADCSCGILIRKPIARSLTVEMNKAPVIDEHLTPSYVVKEGNQISLCCKYTAFPKAEVIWLRDNQQIDLNLMGLSKDFKITIDADSTNLQIKEAYPDDSGAYSVLVRNQLGQARSSTQLFVKENSHDASKSLQDMGRPTILRNLKNIEAREDDQIRLELFVSGEPQPDIKWYQNDVQIFTNDHRVFLMNDEKYSLLIDNCSVSDSGEYKAVVSNIHGEVQSKCRLNVYAKPIVIKTDEAKAVTPYFIELVKDIKVNPGQDVCFKCKVAGEPDPEVRWYKDGVLLYETNKIKMARQGDNSYLVLTDTDNENSGVYMASASNSHGESKSYGRLSVNESTTINGVTTSKSSTIEKRSTSGGSPKKGGQPPEFKKLFYDRHVQAGEAVRIDAVITGSPKPRIKWFFNNDVPQENCRCIMAGDTYSFIIDEFEEKNCGRYTIQAENNYGKASCSAECLFEGSEFMGSENAPALETGNIITEEIYSKNGPANSMTSSYSQSQTIRTESKSIETIPVNTRDLSIQSSIPQMKDTSSQIQYNTKDLGIQINPDQRDKGSQLNQSSNTEIKSYSNQMAPLVQNSEESHFSSVNESRSYSYSQSSHVVDSSSGGTRVRIDSKDPTVGITIRATPERNNSASHIDFSTTLIKDINQNKNQHQFEPVELILNSSNTRSGASPYREMHSSSNAYVEESYHHKPQTRYEPVNLIVQKPTCGMGRSGSLPPIKSRVNYKQSHHHRNDFNETDEEIIHVNHCHNKENTHSYGQESKMSYYKDIERRSANRSNQFKPVELVLDASTLSDSGKRCRDLSDPCSMKRTKYVPCTYLVPAYIMPYHTRSSSFLFDEVDCFSNDTENITSDFISDREPHVHVRHHTHGSQHQLHQRHHHHQQHLHRGSVSSVDERYSHHHQTEYPTMEMTIDVKSPPSIDVPLRNAQATEGHAVKLECVVSGKPNPTMKWYKEGNEIDPNTSDNVIISYDSNLGLAVLIIKQVSFNDTGRFTCVARNALGSCSTSASVNVQGHGKKSPSPRSQSDSPVRKVKQFEPGFYQTKPATMTFNPNNQAISYQQAIQSYSTHKPVNFYSQTEVKPTQNNVQMMPSMPQQPQRVENVHRIVTATKPQIVKHLQNQTVQPGNKALMQCVVKGSPDEVKWFHNGNPCNLSSQAPRFPITYDKFTGLTTMSIINARPEDAGQITCIASNSAGTDTSTAWLVVKEPSVEKPMYQPPQQPQQPFKINAGPVHRPKETTPLRFGNIESAKVPEAPMRAQSAPQKPVEIVRAYQKYPEVAKPQEQPQIVDPSQMIRPRIIEPLKNVEFVEGGQAVFECRVEGNPLNVQWFKGPRELFNQFRYKMAFDPSTGIARMMIGTVLEDDAGDYTCRVSNPIGDANTTGALVPMMKQPPTDFWNKKPSIPIGEPVPPKPSNKNKPLMEELGQRQRERKASRQPSERPPSTNAYPDEVFDNKPNDMQPLPAKILKGLKNEQFRENDTIVLKALIAGYPYPRASWFKNNMPLVMSQRHSCHNDEGKRICGVKIKNATPEDSGVYSLVVENPYGADDSSCQIVVMPPEPRMRQMSVDSVPYSPVPEQAYPVKFEESQNAIPPKFVVGLPPNDKIVEGEPIRLSCQVEGSPKPNITWLKDGNPLPTSLRFTTDYNPQTGVATLNVAGTLSNDCGTYTAVAENPAGKAYTTSQVMIKQPHRYDSQDDSCASDTDVPLNRAKPPKVIHGLRDVKEKEGNPINMACKIDGFPKPTLTWLKNGAPLQASNRYNTTYDLNTGVARLKINDTVLGDAGVYSVIAENKAGQDQTNGRLEIIKDSNIDDKPIVNPQAFQYIQPPPPTPPMEAFGPGHLRRGPSPAPRQREPSTQPIPVNLKPIPDSIYVPNDDENKPLSPPKVVVPLKDLRVSEGAPVNLMTKIIGYPIPMIKWLHNNRPVNESSRFTTNYDHTTGIASFKINGTQANDIGTYTAIAENPAGSADTTSKLALTPVSLIDTNPIVNPNAFRYLEKPTRERPRDDSADTPVSAIKPPKFVVPLSNITVKQGAHTDLLCKLEGYPFPTVSWFKDNKPLPASNRLITNYNLNSGLVYLKIADTQLGDAGYYTAVAENKAGQDQTFCSIQVTEQPNVDCTPMVNPDAFRYLENHPSDRNPRPDDEQLKPPKVIIPLSNVKLEEGQKVQLACKIEGSPRPKLTWFKDGEPLPAANRFTTNYDYYTNIAELKIDNASMNDVGSYVCLAENKVGKDQTFCSIFVKEMPNVDETPLVNPEAFKYLENPPKDAAPNTDDENVNLEPPKVIIPLKDMIIKEGEPVLLVSKIIGKPKPKLTWYKNDEPLMASQRYDIEHNLSTNVGMLNIKQAKAQDIGTYRVMAENAAGKCDTQGKLFVENVPNIDETAYINPSKFRALDDPKNPLNADDSDSGEKQPVLIVNPLEDQECFEGETVMFICDLTGSPKPTINWTKDGAPLQAAQRLAFNYIINEGKAIFLISNVKTDDQGEYTVTGKNSAGQASSSAKLKVKSVPSVDDTSYVNPDVFQKFDLKKTPEVSAPADKNSRLKIVEPLKDFHLVEGNKAIFYCKIDAYPKAETQWYKDGAPLAASQRVMTSYNMHSGVATLVIEGATANDKGTYKCVASNIAGTDETSAKLIIQVAPNIDETSYINPDALRKLNHVLPGAHPEDPNDEKYKKPYFVKVPKNTEVPEGSFIRLDCLAFGRPTPVLTWYKDGKELKEDAGHKTLINEEGVHSLLINAATFDDSGTYSCVARNKVGEASFSIDLKVVDKDAHIAPHFIEHLKNVIIPEGKDAVLSATCSGKPQPTVSWQKNDKPVNEKEYRIDTNGGHSKLHIVNATKNDEGWYQCSAVNPAGSTVTKTKVSVIPVGAVNVMNPDLSHLIKQPPQPEVPNFVKALGKLKHVKSGLNPVEPEKERDYDPVGQNFGSIWSKDELQDEETMYDKDRPIPPKFKTQFKAQLNLRERDTAHYEAKLIPIGDPTMKIEWLRNGEPLRSAARYEIKYDFGFVSLNILWSYPEDDGIYECVATNAVGQDKTRAELKCKGNRSIIYDSQLPDGMEGYLKIQERDDKLKQAMLVHEEAEEEETPDPAAPEILMKLEDNQVDEGGMVKFMTKITGYPKPRVTWFVNKTHAISGSRFKLKFDGMIHYLDIPKTSKLDEGTVRCYAKNIHGEVETSCLLKVNPKADFRALLKNPKTGERHQPEPEPVRERMTTPERTILDRLPMLNPHHHHKQKPVDNRILPVFTKQLEPTKVNEGISILLEVEYNAIPVPEVFWYKDGFQMQSSNDFFIESTSNKSTLKIREAFKSDSGMYQVKLFNEMGSAASRAYFTVVPANLSDLTPTILLQLKNINCNSGDPIKFQSQAIGNPSPVITWFKDDEKLEMSSRIKEFQEDNTYTCLIVETAAADSGCYEMVAENAHGKVYTRAYLTVLGDAQVEDPKPIEVRIDENNVRSVPVSSKFTQPAINVPIKDQTVNEGSPVKFECDIANSDQATVEWFKEDPNRYITLIKQSKYFNMQTEKNKHTLNILEAFPEDEGQYKCVVKNPAGQVTTAAFLKIKQNAQIPVILNKITDTTVDENQAVEFTARVSGEPTPQVEWSHKGEILKNGVNFQIQSDKSGIHTLKLKQARTKDAGDYKFRAFTSAGSVECQATLFIKNVNAALTNNQLNPNAILFAQGSNARIEVHFDNQFCRNSIQPTSFNWFFNNIKIKQSKRFSIINEKEKSLLVINDLQKSHTGTYTIQAVGKNLQPKAEINIDINKSSDDQVKKYEFVRENMNYVLMMKKEKPKEDDKQINSSKSIEKNEKQTKEAEKAKNSLETQKTKLSEDLVKLEPAKAVDEPVKSVKKPIKPVKEPVEAVGETVKAAEEPVKLVEEPVKAAEEPVKPVEESVKPVEESVKAVEEPVKVVEEPIKALDEPVKDVEEPVKAVEKPIKFLEESVKNVDEPVNALEEPVKAIDEKVKAAEEPVKPVGETVKSIDQPVKIVEETIKPVEEPVKVLEEAVKAAEEPVKPVEEPVKPVGEPVKAAEEPLEPVEEPVKPVEEPVKAIDESVKLVEEPVKVVEEPVKALEKPVKAAEEPVKPVEESVKVVEEAVNALEEPVKVVEEPIKALDEPVKDVDESVKVVEKPVNALEEPVTAIGETVKAAEEPVNPVGETVKPVGKTVKAAEEPVKALEEPIKAAEDPVKPVEESVKPVEESVKAVDEAVKSIDQPVKVVEEPIKALEEPVKAVDESVKVVEEPVNTLEERVKAIGETVKAAEEPVKPVGETVKAAKEPIKPVEEPVKIAEEPVKPVGETVKPVEEPVKSIDQPVKVVEEPIKPVEEPVKVLEEPVKAAEEPVKPVEEPVKAVGEPVKALDEPVKPVEEPVKAIDESVKVLEEPVKAVEEPVKSVDEPVKVVEQIVKAVEEPESEVTLIAGDQLFKPQKETLKNIYEVFKDKEEPVEIDEESVNRANDTAQSIEKPLKVEEKQENLHEETLQVKEILVKSQEEPIKNYQFAKLIEEPEKFQVSPVETEEPYRLEETPSANDSNHSAEKLLNAENQSVTTSLTETDRESSQEIMNKHREEMLFGKNNSLKTTSQNKLEMKSELDSNNKFHKKPRSPKSIHAPRVSEDKNEDKINWQELNSKSSEEALNNVDSSFTTISNISKKSEDSSPKITDDILNLITEINESTPILVSGSSEAERIDNSNFKIENPMNEIIDQFGNFLTTSQDTFTTSQDSFAEIERQVIAEEQEVEKAKNSAVKAPTFSQKLVDLEFQDRDNLHLDCFVQGHQPILIEWYLNGELIMPSDDSNIEIFRESGVCSLEIISANSKYEGEFKCHASNAFGYDTTICVLKMQKSENLNKIEFTEYLQDQIVEFKSEVFLDCTIINMRKTDRIEWFLNHSVIVPDSDENIEIFTESGVCSLQIRQMTHELQGYFACKVLNADGYVLNESGCFVNVEEPSAEINVTRSPSKLSLFTVVPSFVIELNKVTVIREGEKLALNCRINKDCDPKPTILWFRDGQLLKEGQGLNTSMIYDKESGDCKLVIDNCEKFLNQGIYLCTAAIKGNSEHFDYICKTMSNVKIISNDNQSVYESSSDEKMEHRGIPPMFLQSLEDVELEEGEELELKCQIMGAPIPEVACFYAKNISEQTSIKRVRSELLDYNYETGIFRIIIKNTSNEANEGFYMVKAVNEAGSLTTVCQVKVKCKSYPVLKVDNECAPEFMNELNSEIKAMDGQQVSLTCICKSLPVADIKWLRNTPEDVDKFIPVMLTNDIKSSYDIETGKVTLKICDAYPQDTGVYKCTASNDHGKAETRTSLTIEPYTYEQDSEEGSACMPSVNNTDTEGTLTPTPYRQYKRTSDTSPYLSDNSSLMLEQSKQLIKALRENQKSQGLDKTLTETDYFSPASDSEMQKTESASNSK